MRGEKLKLSPDEQAVLLAFDSFEVASLEEIAERTKLPGLKVMQILEKLTSEGLIGEGDPRRFSA
jgi:sugar-specific transcriptional regulator TrmB